MEKARDWLISIEKYIQIIDTSVNSKSLYKTIIPFAENLGYYEEINDRQEKLEELREQIVQLSNESGISVEKIKTLVGKEDFFAKLICKISIL